MSQYSRAPAAPSGAPYSKERKDNVRAQAPQALVVRNDFFNLYTNVQVVKRDIVTAVIYCYITTEFDYAKRDSRCVSAYIC